VPTEDTIEGVGVALAEADWEVDKEKDIVVDVVDFVPLDVEVVP
jgi:hypothetical protein